MAYKYVYKNVNPAKKETGDCVIRAIALAEGREWLDVFNELTDIALEQYTLPNSKEVYQPYLDAKYERIPVMHQVKGKKKRMTARMLAGIDPEGTYILRTAHHLTTLVTGKCYDIWDSGDTASYIVWKVK